MSAFGYALLRAELYATDGDGKRIPAKKPGVYTVPCHETRPTPNSTHGYEEREHLQLAEIEHRRRLGTLNPEERAVYDLRLLDVRKVRSHTFTAAEWEVKRSLDYTLIRTLKNGDVDVERLYIEKLSYEEMSAQLGLTARQVHARLVSGNRKLRSW